MAGRVRAFWWIVLVLVALAVLLRVGFALAADHSLALGGDANKFRVTAAHVADGDGYTEEDPSGAIVASSEHPPAFPAVLAAMDLVGLRSTAAQRVGVAVWSGLAVAIVAVLGRRLGSDRIGLVAAGIAAVHPLWIQPAGVLMSEALVLVLVPLLLLAAVTALERPVWWVFALVGLCGGALVLTRTESALTVAVVAVALLVLDRRRVGQRLASIAVVLACVAALVVPWMARNAARVDSFTVSTNLGATVAGSYCDATFGDTPRFGGWSLNCAIAPAVPFVLEAGDRRPPPRLVDDAGRTAAKDFASEHRRQLPRVMLARVGRLWGVAHSGSQLSFDVNEGRQVTAQRAGQYLHWVLLALAVMGAVVLPRGWWRSWSLVAIPAFTTTVSAAVIYGSTRMRASVEPTIALFAAAAVVWTWARLSDRAPLDAEAAAPDEDLPVGAAQKEL